MIYYYILFFLSIFSVFPKNIDYKGLLHKFYFLVSFGLLLFAGLRLDSGFDFENYNYTYDSLVKYGQAWNIEPLIQFLMYFTDFLNLGYSGFLFLIALLAIGLKSNVFYKYVPYPFLALLLYYSRTFIGSDFGQIRQGLALGIILFSFQYVVNRNLKKFLLCLLFSVFIHASSIMFLPFYFLAKLKLKTNFLLLLLIITIPLALVDFKQLISSYIAWMPAFVSAKVDVYATGEAEETIGLTFSLVFRVLIILFIVFFRKKFIYENVTYLSMFNIYYFGVIFYLVFNSFPQLGGRGSTYFQQFEIILIPIIIYSFKNPIVRFLMFVCIIFYCYWGLDATLESQPESFFPYKNLLLE